MLVRSILAAVCLSLCAAGCASILGVGKDAASLNEFRIANGLAPLARDGNLTSMAAAHSADMARRGAMDHGGFMESRGPRGARAENVAYGCKDEPCTIRQWIDSSGHRANMLRRDVTRYGLASAVSEIGPHLLDAAGRGIADPSGHVRTAGFWCSICGGVRG